MTRKRKLYLEQGEFEGKTVGDSPFRTTIFPTGSEKYFSFDE